METLEELKSRHSKEKKELQNKITSKKKQATKKNGKGINSECDELETSLRFRHEEELAALSPVTNEVEEEAENEAESAQVEGDDPPTPIEQVTNEVSSINLNNSPQVSDTTPSEPQPNEPGKKRNRQKERLARRAAEQEAEAVEAEKEALKMPNWKKQERSGMLALFASHNLVEEEIRPDGHCLFSAVADQLSQLDIPLDISSIPSSTPSKPSVGGYKIVRRVAADYIEEHKEEFEGFMEVPIGIYAYRIRETAEWGGHLEIQAIARAYGVEISVVRKESVDVFEPEGDKEERKKIWLAYYLHGYGLGEHYNSLRQGKIHGE